LIQSKRNDDGDAVFWIDTIQYIFLVLLFAGLLACFALLIVTVPANTNSMGVPPRETEPFVEIDTGNGFLLVQEGKILIGSRSMGRPVEKLLCNHRSMNGVCIDVEARQIEHEIDPAGTTAIQRPAKNKEWVDRAGSRNSLIDGSLCLPRVSIRV
jgi:hypothetical protein